MKIDELYEYLVGHRPQLMHISGKTSVGKTTLANQLVDRYEYYVIELDQVVLKYVIDKFKLQDSGHAFIEVYKNRQEKEWIKSFIDGAHGEINNALAQTKPVILDGAIANTDTLKDLLEPYPATLIIYLHPQNIDNYLRNLVNRFNISAPTDNAGLPSKFWAYIDKDELAQYYDNRVITSKLMAAIREYAEDSKKESKYRLIAIANQFEDTVIVEI
jgi:guanylate kinase